MVDSKDFLKTIWAKLRDAIDSRSGAWRTPTLATVDAMGAPNARVIVLRAMCVEHFLFEFYTDSASQKVEDIEANAYVSLCFWDPNDKLQLRLHGMANLADKEHTTARWQALNRVSQSQYRQYPQPGQPIMTGQPIIEGSTSRFVVYEIKVKQLDALQLASPSHLRLKAEFVRDTWVPTQVAP